MNQERANEILGRLRAHKERQAEKKAAKCPGPLEGAGVLPFKDPEMVEYCRNPCSGCEYEGEPIEILGADDQKYLCDKNGTKSI